MASSMKTFVPVRNIVWYGIRASKEYSLVGGLIDFGRDYAAIGMF